MYHLAKHWCRLGLQISESHQASVRCDGQTSLIPGGPNLQLTRMKGSPSNIFGAGYHTTSSYVFLQNKERPTQYYAGGFNVMADWDIYYLDGSICFISILVYNCLHDDTIGKAKLFTLLHAILIMCASVIAWFAGSGTWGNGCDGHGSTRKSWGSWNGLFGL